MVALAGCGGGGLGAPSHDAACETGSAAATDAGDAPGDVPVGVLVIPAADPDAGSCVVGHGLDTTELVCFGNDEAAYATYLDPRDGGWAIGTCPAPGDFMRTTGEGSCGYNNCGPLLPAAVEGIT